MRNRTAKSKGKSIKTIHAVAKCYDPKAKLNSATKKKSNAQQLQDQKDQHGNYQSATCGTQGEEKCNKAKRTKVDGTRGRKAKPDWRNRLKEVDVITNQVMRSH